jgi:transposase
VINGILFRERTGLPWRDLPERFGKWKTVYERHRRWSADGTWERILQAVQADADVEDRIDWTMVGVDSTSCRAHQHAAGARRKAPRTPKKRSSPRQHRPDEGLGRSRGGLTSKIHLASDGGCRPLALLVTPGQWGDAPQMIPVLERIRVPRTGEGRPRTTPDRLSADKTSHADRRQAAAVVSLRAGCGKAIASS